MKARLAILCILPGAWALACGGRYEQTIEGEGAPSAGTSSADTSSGGGGLGCACDPIACAPPFHAVPKVGGCCYDCQLDLTQCAQESSNYRKLRQQTIDKYNSLSCMSDADCILYHNQNQCGVPSCGLSLLSSAIEAVDQSLNSYAQSSCSPACPDPADITCPLVPPARCVMRHCI